MPRAEAGSISVHLGALDDTTARSVASFLGSRHRERFVVTAGADADVLLVDLDRPAACAAIQASPAGQVVVGVGFASDPALDGCTLYVQKPLTGAVVTDVLAEAAPMAGSTTPHPTAPRPDRSSHGRGVLRATTRWEPSPTTRTPRRADWSALAAPTAAPAPPAVPLDRAVFARADTLAQAVAPTGSTGAVGELFTQWREVERIDPHDAGSLSDPEVLATVQYSPAQHLDGLVRQTLHQHPDRPWEITGDWGTLAYDATTDDVLLASQDTTVRVGCHRPLEPSIRVRPLSAPPSDDRRRVPRDVALWNLSVWCSRGRLPDELDPFAAVSMRAWPDLARSVLTPSVLPIVALLTAGAHRPVDIADKIGVSRSHAFVVLAGAHNLGLLEGFDVAALIPEVAEREVPRGIVRRLLARLGAS